MSFELLREPLISERVGKLGRHRVRAEHSDVGQIFQLVAT